MWDKPREIARYRGSGFEIAFWRSSSASSQLPVVSPDAALNGWKTSPGHNAVILNQGIWHDNRWRAIGIGMSEHYAVVWFGEATD